MRLYQVALKSDGYDEQMVFFKDPDGNILALASQQLPA